MAAIAAVSSAECNASLSGAVYADASLMVQSGAIATVARSRAVSARIAATSRMSAALAPLPIAFYFYAPERLREFAGEARTRTFAAEARTRTVCAPVRTRDFMAPERQRIFTGRFAG